MTMFQYKTSKQDDNHSVTLLSLGTICASRKANIFNHYRRGRNYVYCNHSTLVYFYTKLVTYATVFSQRGHHELLQ